MAGRLDDYLARAREFERLALAEDRPEVRKLLTEQAHACYRLATRQSQTAPWNPYAPIRAG